MLARTETTVMPAEQFFPKPHGQQGRVRWRAVPPLWAAPHAGALTGFLLFPHPHFRDSRPKHVEPAYDRVAGRTCAGLALRQVDQHRFR